MFGIVSNRNLLAVLQRIERKLQTMPTIAEVKAAVAAAADQVKTAVQAAVTTETAQVTAQIQALKDQIAQGTPITQADLDEIIGSVNGIAPAATSAIDAISTSDGA